MSNSLEIFQNTLLKLAVRSGSDADRRAVTLDIGEPGFTTDTKRLYIGDGVTPGGILVGNTVLGEVSNFAAITSTPAVNDIIFHTDNSTLYRYVSGDRNQSTSWDAIGRVVTAKNPSIIVNSDSSINVGLLSANNFSNDAVTNSITLSTGRIALSSSIAVNKISPLTNTYLELPRSIRPGNVTYVFPDTLPVASDSMLVSNLTGGLTWRATSTLLSASSATLHAGSNIYLNVNNSATNSTSALLLTSGRIEIGFTGFIPVAHATFKQSGQILRNVGVNSIVPIEASSIQDDNINFTQNLVTDFMTPFDPKVSGVRLTGAYLITLSTEVNIVSSVVDIQIKNATYKYNAQPVFIDQNLSCTYFFGAETSSGKTSQIFVYFYVKTYSQDVRIPAAGTFLGLNLINVNRNYSAHSKYIATPGASNDHTRFSISVYPA